MIAYFPNPYPDELWYSVCARFSNRMQFGTETGVMQALYGSRHAVATVDLPHRLGALVSQLPPGHPCAIGAVIDQQTFLPYYSPFLTTSTYAKVRTWMADSTKASVRVKCGACTNRVRPPKYFRSCAECDRENRQKCGETYWHRLFQLPGVEICPVHEVCLEPSNVRLDPLPNRHKYFSAESAQLPSKAHAMDQKDPAHRILVDLARRVDWLLRQQGLNPGFEILHNQYRLILATKGFLTRAGSVRMNDLRREVTAFFGPKLLDLLQCGLPDENGDGWLGHLLRKTNTAIAPLRHLLLLRALDTTMEDFFFSRRLCSTVEAPRLVSGLWPCLNPVCEHYGTAGITHADLEPPDTNDTRHIILKCPCCGFAYQIREGTEPPKRANRVIEYGPVWTNTLKRHWCDSTITLRHMGKVLGVDPKTVKQRAAVVGLPFPREGKRSVTMRGLYVPVKRDHKKSLESHRSEWCELRRANPAAGTKLLRLLVPALYAWLYRNDRTWLAEHRPRRKSPTVTRVHVDWAERDEELAGQIASIATHIKNSDRRPRRVTVTAIGRALGKQSLFEGALAKLPLTRSVINSVLESGEDFAARRVYAAASRLRRVGIEFPRWRLVKAAGLHYRIERLPKVQTALDYEMRPFVRVLIFRAGDSTPQGLFRRSGRMPSRLRPLAIVRSGT